jgi:hypothetical protein
MTLKDGLLPESFYRNVGDFGEGDTLNIKTVGTVTLQEAAEDTPLTYAPIESGTITLQITDYVGDAWYVTDDLREDGTQIERLMAERSAESTRAIQENFETRFLATAAQAHSASDPYAINGFAHKIVSGATNDIFTTDMLADMRLAFDKANVPQNGRVFIVDPVVEATLNKLTTITHDVTEFGRNILENGLSNGSRYSMSLYGFDLIVSNRLFVGDANDGTNSVTGAVWNIAMCVADDQCKPVMAAWRRQPKVEGERNKDRARDEFVVRARWGFGMQRMDTIGVICTSATATTGS